MRLPLACLWIVLMSTAVAWADFRVSDWKFWASLAAPEQPRPVGGFVRLTLPGQILALAGDGLQDVRLVDDSGVEVPYLLLVERAEVQKTTVPVLILDRGIVPNQYQQVVCDLGEGNSYSNQLQLETPTQNFRRRGDVLGSTDGKNWLQLKTGSHIFDHHEDFYYRNLRVVYPETSYRYLKLVLWLDGGTPLEIQGVRVARVIRKEVEPEKLPARIVRKQEDVKRKATDIFLEIDLERQHLETCVLEIAQENFRRRAEVAFQSKDGIWTQVGEANIYRFKSENIVEDHVTIPLSELNEPQVRLRIWNQDNPPLEVTSVLFERMPRLVIFEWNVAKSYRLFVGSDQARTPSYDLDLVAGQLDITDLPRLEAGPLMPNSDYLAPKEIKPWTEQHPVLLWSALSLGVLLLGWMLLRTLREIKPEE